jgi:hypothetical protein
VYPLVAADPRVSRGSSVGSSTRRIFADKAIRRRIRLSTASIWITNPYIIPAPAPRGRPFNFVPVGYHSCMGSWTYYSPIGIGFLLVLALHESVGAYAPAEWPLWTHWPFALVMGLLCGILCQLLMFGVQGAFAQVLPVPIGRSIRGRGAVLGGGLIIAAVALAAITGLLKSQEMAVPASVTGIMTLASAAGALITYIWCWPLAGRDFSNRNR